MVNRVKGVLLLGVAVVLSVLLCACDAKIDENLLNGEADYSVDIRLPYVTVSPPPAAKAEAQALEIGSDGSVTVNDVAILQENSANDNGSNYKSLRQGNTGFAVQVLQNRLRELGYLTADVTGVFDTETEAAVRRFEQTYGTMQTGVATANLQERLFRSDALVYGSEAYNAAVVAQYRDLRRGDSGSAVYALQQRLMTLGYPISNLSGSFDDETAAAIELFYQAYDLSPSDVANVALQRELYSDSARPYAESADQAATDVSDNINELQRRLIELGYMTGTPNGEYDARSQIAVRLFQQACGELPSTTMSERVLRALASDAAPSFSAAYSEYQNLIEGAGSDAVVRLQARLTELGFSTEEPDGVYSAATSEAVRRFQEMNALDSTGAATIYTQAVLYSNFALNADGEYYINTSVIEEPDEESEPVAEEPDVTSILSSGSSGDDVLKLQNRLTELGYISSVTGEYDALTGRGVATFQEMIGMETNGVADTALLKFLYSNAAPNYGTHFYEDTQNYSTLREGAAGEAVVNLQRRLWELGYLSADGVRNSIGVFNDATAAALLDLQSALGYDDPDGEASPEIQCFLFSRASEAYAR